MTSSATKGDCRTSDAGELTLCIGARAEDLSEFLNLYLGSLDHSDAYSAPKTRISETA